MFEIKDLPEPGPSGKTIAVVDESRDVYLQWISGIWPLGGSMFALVWQSKVIPFDVKSDNKIDGDGSEYIQLRFLSFGSSMRGSSKGIAKCVISDETKRHQAQMLAVEALLMHGENYDGDKKPDGYHQIFFDDKLYRKSDFQPPEHA